MKYRARYKRKGVSPFEPDMYVFSNAFAHIDAEVSDSTPFYKVNKMAKDATPKDFEFLELLKLNEKT
jgi:hypothetical protein